MAGLAAAPIWERPTTIVLHGPNARVGAIDLESKFTEAALGNLHYADWRNFAHGRHHWLAKRGAQSAIIALIGDDDERLAERTLALIPDEIPIAADQTARAAARSGAWRAGRVLADRRMGGRGARHRSWPARCAGIRAQALSLRPAKDAKVRSGGPEIAAIERKAFASYATLADRGQLAFWKDAYKTSTASCAKPRSSAPCSTMTVP